MSTVWGARRPRLLPPASFPISSRRRKRKRKRIKEVGRRTCPCFLFRERERKRGVPVSPYGVKAVRSLDPSPPYLPICSSLWHLDRSIGVVGGGPRGSMDRAAPERLAGSHRVVRVQAPLVTLLILFLFSSSHSPSICGCCWCIMDGVLWKRSFGKIWVRFVSEG